MALNDYAVLTKSERARTRRHAGYLNVAEVSSFALGLPASLQTQFIIEGAMDKLLPEGLPIFREQLATLDAIYAQMIGDLELLAVTEVGSIKLRMDEQPALKREYLFHRADLCNTLGVIPNPFDARFNEVGGPSVNARVIGG